MANKVTMDILAGVSVDSTGLIVNMSSRGTGARSSIGVDSGKAYFEVYVIGTPNIGLCDEMNNLNSTGWPNASSFVIQGGSLDFYIGNTYYAYTYSNVANANNPFTVGFALDMNNHVVNIYFNGVLTMDSFLLKGKIENLETKLYPFLFHGGGSDRRGITEWNFGATPFKYPIPRGYTSYDGNQSNVSKYLLKNNEGYKNLTELISTEIPTEEQFKEKGMMDIPSYGQLSSFNDLVTYTTESLSKALVKFKPKEKTILSSGAINFSGKKLKRVSLIGTDNARVLFSKDRGVTWYNNVSEKIPIVNATSTSPHYYDQTPDKTIDGDKTSTNWQVYLTPFPKGQTGHELILTLLSLYNISSLTITPTNIGNASNVQNGIKDFEVFGVNNDTTKTLLLSATTKNMVIPVTYTIDSKNKYQQIVINFKGCWMDTVSVAVTEIELYGSPPIPISNISTQGLTPTQLTAISPDEWKAFMGDSSTLRFAYYLPDETANTDKLELTVDFIGE